MSTKAAPECPGGSSRPISVGKAATRIGKLGSIYILGGLLAQALRVLVLPIFTRYLPPAQMGIVTLSNGMMDTMTVLIQLGLVEGFNREYFRVPEDQRPLMARTIQLGQLILMGSVCLVLSVAGIWIADPLLPNLPLSENYILPLWLMIVWACFAQGFSRHAASVTQLSEHAWKTISINLLANVVHIVLGLAAVIFLGWQGFGRQVTVFLGSLVAAAYSFQMVWHYGRGRFNLAMFRRNVLSGLTFIPHSLATVLTPTINAWLLNKLVSSEALAIFGVACSIPAMIAMPLASLMRAAYPTVASLMFEPTPEGNKVLARIYSLVIIGVSAMVLVAFMFGPVAVIVLTAPAYHEAAGVVLVLTIAWLFQAYYGVVANPISYAGGGLWLSVATMSSVVGGVVLALILIPPFGSYGAAWTVVGSFFCRFLVAAVVSQRLYPIPWPYFRLLRNFGCVVAVGFVDYTVCQGLPLLVAVAVKISLVPGLVVLLYLTGVVSTPELRAGVNLLLRKYRSFRGVSR